MRAEALHAERVSVICSLALRDCAHSHFPAPAATIRRMPPQLKILQDPFPKLNNATLLLALTGWMDGGEVSTGTVRQIMGRREVKQIARIDPDEFYIYNFPGSMEISALFR